MDIFQQPIIKFGNTEISLNSIIVFSLILLITIIVIILFKKTFSKKLIHAINLNPGVVKAYSRIFTYFILITGILIGFSLSGLPVTGLFAGGAALLVGIGFGIQNIVNNWISGMIILFERPIKEGDFIEVDGILGTVTAIAARSTRILTLTGITIIVPNSKILENKVINRSYVENTQIEIPVRVTYQADIEKVKSILINIANSHELILKEPAPSISVAELAESWVIIKLFVWIKEQTKFFAVKNYVNYEILKHFKQENIEIPYPITEVKLKERL